MRLSLRLFNEDGTEIGRRWLRVKPDLLAESSYDIGRKAEELYRDALYNAGLWEDYNRQGRGRNYWK